MGFAAVPNVRLVLLHYFRARNASALSHQMAGIAKQS